MAGPWEAYKKNQGTQQSPQAARNAQPGAWAAYKSSENYKDDVKNYKKTYKSATRTMKAQAERAATLFQARDARREEERQEQTDARNEKRAALREAQKQVTQMTAAGLPLAVQRQRTLGQMDANGLYARYRAALAEVGEVDRDALPRDTKRAEGGRAVYEFGEALKSKSAGTLGKYAQKPEKTAQELEKEAVRTGGSDAAMAKWQNHWTEDLFQQYLTAMNATPAQMAKRGEMLAGMTWGKEEKQAAKELLENAKTQGLTGNAYNPSNYAPAWEAWMRGDEEEYAKQVEIYDQLYTRLHPKSRAITTAATEAFGLNSAAKLGAKLAGDETAVRTLQSNEKTGRWAQAQNPGLTVATKTIVNLGLMTATGSMLGAATAPLAKGATVLGKAALEAGKSALTFAAKDAIQNAGNVVTGEMSGSEFAKQIAGSAAGGVAGNIMSGLVSSGIAKVLTEKQMMTPFMEYLKNVAGSMAFSTGSLAANTAVSGRKMSGEEIATELTTSFAFALVNGYMQSMASTKAASRAVEQKYDQIAQEFEAIQKHMSGKQFATQAEYEQALKDLRAHVQELKTEVSSTYYGGQQEFVNSMKDALDVVVNNLNWMLSGNTGAAPASGASGMQAADVKLLTEEVASALRSGANEPITPQGGAGMQGAVQMPGTEAGGQLPGAQATGAMLPENMELANSAEPALPENMEVEDRNENGIPDNMEVVSGAEDAGAANAAETGTNTQTKQNAASGEQEASEPEVRTVLRKATGEDAKALLKSTDLFAGKQGSLLREYKGRLKQYDERVRELAQTTDPERSRILQNQIEADEAYLTRREETLRQTADIARARMQNEARQQEADIAEPDPDELRTLERRTQREEQQTEQAAQKGELKADEDMLARFAERKGYSDLLTSYVISGYGGYHESTGKPVEQYAAGIGQAYTQGTQGMKLRATEQMSGIPQAVLQQAYESGKEQNGGKSENDGGKRDAGVDPGQPDRRVEKSTGSAAEKQRGELSVQERVGLENRLRAAGRTAVSTKELGIEAGTDAKTAWEIPQDIAQEYPALQRARKTLTDAGAENVHFVTGTLRVTGENGQSVTVQAITQGTRVWMKASDVQYGLQETAEHEAMHLRLAEDPGMKGRLITAIRKQMTATELNQLAQRYAEAYEGCYGTDMNAYLEEILCDAYAGINRVGMKADRYQSAVREAAGEAQTQQAKKNPEATRGPPAAKHSIVTMPDGKKFVRADRQVIFGNDARAWSEQLEDYINGKIRRGQDVRLVGADGDVLLLTATSAGKLSDNHTSDGRTMSDTAYERKVNAATHIDELAQVSTRGPKVAADTDARHGKMASAGWNYRTAYFEDFDRKYYEVKISVAQNDDGRMIYNVGQMQERSTPQINGSSSASTGAQRGSTSSATSIRASGQKSQGKYSSAASPKDNDKTALAYFGKTYKWSETGYVLLDGSKLDFSGRHEGGPGGYRSVDHRDISDAFDGELGDGSYTGGMVQFMQEGNIRISPESGGINLAVMPTRAQMDSLSDFISRERGEVILDIDDANGNTVSSTEYTRGTHANRVLQDIREYFQSGQTPQVSSEPTVAQFRASAKTEESAGKAYSYDALPTKARQYLNAAVNRQAGRMAATMDIPGQQKRELLKPALRQMMEEYLQTGKVEQSTIDKTFDDAYNAGLAEDREFYDTYKFVKDKMRTTGVAITPQIRADIADFGQFRKNAMGRLLMKDNGMPVDVFYAELHDEAPGLFPSSITNPTDQLEQMFAVSKTIEVTKKTLDESNGEQAEEFKRWARNDYEAGIGEFFAQLRTARRYAEAAERTEQVRYVPKTVEEATKLGEDMRKARKSWERVQRKILLTPQDEATLDKLLRGDLDPEDIQGQENAANILKAYEAKADYAALQAQMVRWRKAARAAMHQSVAPLLENTELAKDKKVGLLYNRETAERNIADVFPEADAEKINRAIFEPVHTEEAKSTKYKNAMRKRVKALGLGTKAKDGDLVSEAHAVQLLGEAQDNIRALQGRPMTDQRDGKTLREWEAVVAELWKTSPKLDKAKIENAVQEFRKIYDELFYKMNEVRVRNGYEPVAYRKGYFPHFQPGQSDGILSLMGKALGMKAEVTALPTSINGITHTFKPGITWFGNTQERLGFNTAYDAVEGFDRYIEGAANVIFQTDNIQRLRAFNQQLRYRTTDDGIRERVDAIRADDRLTMEEKETKVQALYEHAKFELGNMASWLDEYTNLLAGKKHSKDREYEQALGRGFYNVMKWLESRVAANMVAVNPGSWLTNFIPITQAWGYVSTESIFKAMGQTIRAQKNDDGFWENSVFLTNRRGSDPLVRSWSEQLSATLGKPMDWIDTFTADVVVRARYLENMKRGMDAEDAMREADRFAANIMADRSRGATPTMFQSRNPWTKLFTQFQLEVNNQFSNIFKDLPREARERGGRILAMALFKMFFSAWLYNEIYEKFVGRRAALDPIDLANDFVGDATGYKLNNIFDAALGDELIRKGKPAGLGDTVWNFILNTAEELPMVGGLMGGGRVPFSSAVPNLGQIWSYATNKEMAGSAKLEKIWGEVRDPLLYLALPFGGGQIRKVAQGIYAVAKGGKFVRNSKGELQMQYPVYTDDGVFTALRTVQALTFGRNATKEARAWVDENFSKLSVQETNAYLAMTAADVKQKDAWKLIKAMQDVEVPEGASKKQVTLEALNGYDISDEAKTLYYYNVLAGDPEKEKLDALMETGLDMGDYLEYWAKANQVTSDKNADGNAITGSKKQKVYDLLDSYDFTEEQKNAIASEEYKTTGFEPWTERGKKLREAVLQGSAARKYLNDLRVEGYSMEELREALKQVFQREYKDANKAGRKKLFQKICNAYVVLGKTQKEAENIVNGWAD